MLGNRMRRIGFPLLGIGAKDFPLREGRAGAVHIPELSKLG
jgi:hypothetical protein